jgi:hypothetical protein
VESRRKMYTGGLPSSKHLSQALDKD